MAEKIEVIITENDAPVARFLLAPGEYLVGREEDCEILVNVDAVSRHHAKLFVGADASAIEDLGSANGTVVNDHPIAGLTMLAADQPVGIGTAVLVVRPVEAPGKTETWGRQLRRYLPPDFLRDRKYAVGQEIARGAMGSVLDARDASIQRKVAMKVMLRQDSTAELLRFIEEAQITGQLEHPNIVPIHELGVDAQGRPFYTMKLVRGHTLRAVLDGLLAGDADTLAKYSLRQLLVILMRVCDALAYAHSKRVIHRDIKPDNIMLGNFGEVWLMDWGLAKILDQPTTAGNATLAGLASMAVSVRQEEGNIGSTMAGDLYGTPLYMSPEQASGDPGLVDTRSDIYALGAVLYQMLTLEHHVGGRTALEIISKVREGRIVSVAECRRAPKAPPLPHCPGGRVPDSLAAVAMKALSLDPEDRYQSAQAMRAEIDAYLGGFATSAEHAGFRKQLQLLVVRNKKAFAVGAAALLALLAVAGVSVWKIVESERRATAALANLRATAPTDAAQAAALIEAHKFEQALDNIDHAIDLAPERAEYHVQRGNILQSLLRLPDARAAYAKALELDAKSSAASTNLALCDRLVADNGGKPELSPTNLRVLQESMRQQGRSAEAVALLGRLGANASALLTLQKIFRERGLPPEKVEQGPTGGFLTVHLERTSIENTAFLKGAPINRLHLSQTKVIDLSPLEGMPLEKLYINNMEVSDVSVLKGMQLQELWAVNTNVKDLTPLRGMPLHELHVGSGAAAPGTPFSNRRVPIENLDVLQGMTLVGLEFGFTNVSDLSPLRGMHLKLISIQGTRVSDLGPLEGMPLEVFVASFTSTLDLRPLHGMALRKLDLNVSTTSDLGPLRDCSLTGEVALQASGVRDLSPLRGKAIQILNINDTQVGDLSPLEGMPLERLNLRKTNVTDLMPLQKTKLKEIYLPRTRVSDLSPLQFLTELESIDASDAPVSDLRPLKNLSKLKHLGLSRSRVTDLSPLTGNKQLSTLTLDGCTELRDVAPLATCTGLVRLAIPEGAANIERLRDLPNLRYLTYQYKDGNSAVAPSWKPETWPESTSVAEFWKAFDAAKKKE